MLTFTTTSGAEYGLDGQRVVRLDGPFSPGIDYDTNPDGVWINLTEVPDVRVGHPVVMHLLSGGYRITTPVVRFSAVGAL